MFGMGFEELLVILAIILVLFGGTKLPELSRSISQAIKELRSGFSDNIGEKTSTKKTKK